MSRSRYGIILFIVLLIGIPIAFLVVSKFAPDIVKKEQIQKAPAVKIPAPEEKTTFSGLEVAKRIAKFLDKTTKSDGTFTLSFTCEKKYIQICRPLPPGSAPHTGQIILAYYDLYKKTNNPSHKNKSDKAMEYVLKNCANKADFCEWNFFPLYIYYKDTQDNRYKDGLLSVADRFLADISLKEYVAKNTGIKLWMLYDITGEQKYRDLLIKNADAIIAGRLVPSEEDRIFYKAGSVDVTGTRLKVLWSDILPAYRVTNDSKYLKFAKDFLKEARVGDHSEFLAKTTGINSSILTFPIEVLLDLAILVPDEKEQYENEAVRIAQEVLTSYGDTPSDIKFTGDNAMLQKATGEKNVKETLINGWFARLFVRMDELAFTL